MMLPNNSWAHPWQEILEDLDVSQFKGLTFREVKRRRKQFGLNHLRKAKVKSTWFILSDQFKSLMTALLGVATVVSFAFGDWVDGLAISAVILINAAIGFFTEWKAVRSMEALHRLSIVSVKVRRDGKIEEIHASQLVPGDIVILEGGDVITADLRLIEASKLQIDESSLTGESVPISKRIEPIRRDAPLAERKNMAFKGTAVTRGSGEGVVVATGLHTELGQISSLIMEVKEEKTPLEIRLDQLGRKLIWVTMIVAIFVILSGISTGKDLLLMIETGVALAVATIPEGLPIVATIAMAKGMFHMAQRNALVNRLSAVETLGATNVICTDKTGTLTENRMAVTQINLDSIEIEVGRDVGDFKKNGELLSPQVSKVLEEALTIGVLCNNASLEEAKGDGDEKVIGDPLEHALLVAGRKGGIHREELLEKFPEVREEAFDPDIKMMATFHREDSWYRVAVKGAPEAVLHMSTSNRTDEDERELNDEARQEWLRRNQKMAENGLRVLALATKLVKNSDDKPYERLTFLGLIGLLDPPRREVSEAIASCQKAGIKVIMATGDQPFTARNVAMAVGLTDKEKVEVLQGNDLRNPNELSEEDRARLLQGSIFARVSPKQKLDLITLHQKNNSIVAMTGDGVNDAPALKKADIGVAMGQRGTQVAREAADMVLKDDSFSTIVTAIEQGRVIFNNIRKFVLYLLSCNLSEVMVVGLASLLNAPLPILPLQILFLNLVTDVFPALALGVGEGSPTIMKYRPRNPKEPILTRSYWLAISGYGMLITISVLGALFLGLTWLKMGKDQAVTISFLTLAFAQLWHVFNMRDSDSCIFRNEITRNPYVWEALALCTGLLISAVYFPGLSKVLKVSNPGVEGWILIIVMSMIPWVIGQIVKLTQFVKIFRMTAAVPGGEIIASGVIQVGDVQK